MENNGEEMLKMFEQAMALSKAFSGSAGGGGDEAAQGMDDMQKMAQVIQIYQMFKGFNGQTAETNNNPQPSKAPPPETPPPKEQISNDWRSKEPMPKGPMVKASSREQQPKASQRKTQPEYGMGYYDDAIHTPELNSIKAAIPYLEQKYRKRVGMFVKLLEMQKLMEMYAVEAAGMGMGQPDADWRRGMLRAIHPHMPPQKKHMVELIIKVIDINEIMLKMKEVRVGNVD